MSGRVSDSRHTDCVSYTLANAATQIIIINVNIYIDAFMIFTAINNDIYFTVHYLCI